MVGIYDHLIPNTVGVVAPADDATRRLQERELSLQTFGLLLSAVSIVVSVYALTRERKK